MVARSASLRSLLPLLATLPRRRPPVRLCASSPSPKHNLLGLSEPELTALVVDQYNQPKFRAKQLHEWMYEKGVTDFDAMANLPKNFRAQLSAEAACGTMEISHERVSGDGTRKRLWRCDDGALIESVLMPYNDGRRYFTHEGRIRCTDFVIFWYLSDVSTPTRPLAVAHLHIFADRSCAAGRCTRAMGG